MGIEADAGNRVVVVVVVEVQIASEVMAGRNTSKAIRIHKCNSELRNVRVNSTV